MEEQRVGARSLTRNILRGRGACWSFRMGIGRMKNINYSHEPPQNQTRSWLMHSLTTFVAKTSHGQTRIHKIHHAPDLGEATTFPLIIYFVPLHEAHIQMTFCPETLKWESQNCQSWDFCNFGAPITLRVDLRFRWGLKQSYSPHWELSNGISHATYTQGNRVYSWLLAVGSQIVNLTPDPSFGHNLCFKCSNGHASPF
jgi:hypothetical protein